MKRALASVGTSILLLAGLLTLGLFLYARPSIRGPLEGQPLEDFLDFLVFFVYWVFLIGVVMLNLSPYVTLGYLIRRSRASLPSLVVLCLGSALVSAVGGSLLL